jgi:hypothetical protein
MKAENARPPQPDLTVRTRDLVETALMLAAGIETPDETLSGQGSLIAEDGDAREPVIPRPERVERRRFVQGEDRSDSIFSPEKSEFGVMKSLLLVSLGSRA